VVTAPYGDPVTDLESLLDLAVQDQKGPLAPRGEHRLELVERMRCSCHCRFAELALLKARLADHAAVIEHEAFDADGAALLLAVPAGQFSALQRALADLSRGRIALQALTP